VDVPVLVARADPVGLILACELERLGVAHRIVDAAPEPAAVSRATHLHARTSSSGEPPVSPNRSSPPRSHHRRAALLRGPGGDSARLRQRRQSLPAAVSLPQSDLEALLEERLDTAVEPRTAARLVAQGDTTWTDVGPETVEAGFLVACDGVRSKLREVLGIVFGRGDYPGRWAAVDATVEGWPYGPAEIPVFLDAGGFWAMPLPAGRLRLFFRDDAAGERPTAPRPRG
jgi:2-polyprenyl-6-methoxyphenol hydroxylase-like FAD-dependent oxidoreductase